MSRDYYKELGVKPFINAAGAYSALGGARMRPQVVDAIEVHWDVEQYKITPAAVKQALRDGDPSIEIRALFLSDGQIHLTATMLKDGEAEIVTSSLRNVLAASA